MTNNKSPGTDGILREFSKHFWNEIDHIYNSITLASNKDELSPSESKLLLILSKRRQRLDGPEIMVCTFSF